MSVVTETSQIISFVTVLSVEFEFVSQGLPWSHSCHHSLVAQFCFRNEKLILVIELSGVQFGLKSYVWFQNQTSARREFDLKSQVWFQTKIARHEVQLPLNNTILKSQSIIVNINILFVFLHFHFDGLKKGCNLEQKMVQFGNKSHHFGPIRFQGSPVISKWM